MNKKFENFKNFLTSLKYSFICISETWLNDFGSCYQNYELTNYKNMHQINNHSRVGEVSFYIRKSFSLKIRYNLSISCKDNESLSVEIISNTVYIMKPLV